MQFMIRIQSFDSIIPIRASTKLNSCSYSASLVCNFEKERIDVVLIEDLTKSSRLQLFTFLSDFFEVCQDNYILVSEYFVMDKVFSLEIIFGNDCMQFWPKSISIIILPWTLTTRTFCSKYIKLTSSQFIYKIPLKCQS